MNDPIKAALDEAAKRLCFGHDGQECDMCVDPVHCYKAHVDRRKDAAFAIAAFLRALPDWSTVRISGDDCYFAKSIAAAVEQAARDD